MEIPSIGKTFMGKLYRIDYNDKNPEEKRIIEEELRRRKEDRESEDEDKDGGNQGNPANLNSIPWPEELVPNIPKASDLVNKASVEKIDAANSYIEIIVYMSMDDAEAYYARFSDFGLEEPPFLSAGDLLLDGYGNGFYVQCVYFTVEQYMRIWYYVKN